MSRSNASWGADNICAVIRSFDLDAPRARAVALADACASDPTARDFSCPLLKPYGRPQRNPAGRPDRPTALHAPVR